MKYIALALVMCCLLACAAALAINGQHLWAGVFIFLAVLVRLPKDE